MARPHAEDPKTIQVNLRLTQMQADALEALAFVLRLSPTEALRQVFDEEVTRRRREDPLFATALRIRLEAHLRREGKLATLPHADEAS